MTVIQDKSLLELKRYVEDYSVQIERARNAIALLQVSNPTSEEFTQALADLHVCATVLSPYSEGLLEAIDYYSEKNPD